MDQPEKALPDALAHNRDGRHPCPYLPGRTAENLYALVSSIDPGGYQALLAAGYRRSGIILYRPDCPGCRECRPIRVPVARFRPSRSQRRVARRNADLEVRTGRPRFTTEKFLLYSEYVRHRHDRDAADDPGDLHRFLYSSPVRSLEMEYRLGGRLVAVGMVDVASAGLSAVYFFFDPAESRRSLGIFGGLCEIAECARRGLPHWYLGYYIPACRKMNYKAQFRPFELLGPDGAWHEGGPAEEPAAAAPAILPAAPKPRGIDRKSSQGGRGGGR
jgi:arginine-tRNA-protein transferase